MNIPSPTLSSDRKFWGRSFTVTVLKAALSTGENRFAQRAALAWLAAYPGDLQVQFLRAQALTADGHTQQALPILKSLCLSDPEYLEAQELLSKMSSRLSDGDSEIVLGSTLALGGEAERTGIKALPPEWGLRLQKLRKAIQHGQYRAVETHIHAVLAEDPQTPLAALTHLQMLAASANTPKTALLQLAGHYRQRWPDCLQIMLILADAQMACGEAEQAVALLHRAASLDVAGQAADRLWGKAHPYRTLWPENLNAYVDLQIPAGVAAALGWNLLAGSHRMIQTPVTPGLDAMPLDIPSSGFSALEEKSLDDLQAGSPLKAGSPPEISSTPEKADERPPIQIQDDAQLKRTPASSSPEKETPISLHDELEVHSRRPRTSGPDGRFPVYVVFSTQTGLRRKYGDQTARILDQAMRGLVAAVRKHMDWGGALIYADDPASMARYDLKPVAWNDAWQLKLALADLDDALRKRGARIGTVLIVGGPDVVPFHNLPNPTDDDDAEVPSDNPYASRDENYFIPEWPLGRLPGGAGKDPGVLLGLLREMAARYAVPPPRRQNWLSRGWQWLTARLRPKKKGGQASFGFSAEAWRRASIAVFRPIGEARSLFTSPPIQINGSDKIPVTPLGYFNLHGVADAAEWFGQREASILGGLDSSQVGGGTDYPVALHPREVVNGGCAPQMVFSEACYGANISNKAVEEALALKFLASGSQALVGSTVISYGSIAPPLNAADLLGKSFWKFLKEGHPAGEALRRAKIHLAREMHNRQGYLDGEDQKTLISFVLYGDPLAKFEAPAGLRLVSKKLIKLPEPMVQVKTVCDRVDYPGTSEPIPEEVMSSVKKVVEQYLPGMRGANLSLSYEHGECSCQGHHCPTSQLGAKTRPDHSPHRRVVTLSKSLQQARRTHPAFARLTLDQEGKVVKLAVSR